MFRRNGPAGMRIAAQAQASSGTLARNESSHSLRFCASVRKNSDWNGECSF